MRASAPILTLPACSGRQIDVHVDIRHVEHGEDLAAGRQHFADIGDAVLDAAVARRDQRIVGDIDLIEFDVVGRGVERMFGLADAGVGGVQKRRAPFERLPALVQNFVGRVAARDERSRRGRSPAAPAAPALLLHDIGIRLLEAALRLLHLGLGLLERGFEIPRIHARDDLAGVDQVALVGQHFGDAARRIWCRCRSRRPRCGRCRTRCPRAAAPDAGATSEPAGAGAAENQRQSQKQAPARLPARRRRCFRRRREPLRRGHERTGGRLGDPPADRPASQRLSDQAFLLVSSARALQSSKSSAPQVKALITQPPCERIKGAAGAHASGFILS